MKQFRHMLRCEVEIVKAQARLQRTQDAQERSKQLRIIQRFSSIQKRIEQEKR